MKAIINANVVLINGILWDGVVLIEDGKIKEVKSAREIEIPENAEIIDACGAYVGPGFVDIHVHGGNNGSTCFETVETARFFLKHGTTSLLATPSYDFDREKTIDAINSIKKAMDSGEAKTVKGIYAEGPYTNPKYGSHADLNPWKGGIKAEDYVPIVDAAGDYVKVWAIAPELEHIKEFAEYARKVNPDVIFALGHSDATPMQTRAMGKCLPKILTHAMCATKTQPTYGGTRGYGPDEYCFKEPDMYAELISDSLAIHVHPEMQQLLLHNKGINKVILITDSTVHDDPAPEHLKHVTDLNFDHNGGIAGSKITMDQACRNIMTHTNCGIAQSFIMASLNPAKALGFDEEIGSIEVGKTADIIFVDDKFNVEKVMLSGEVQKF